MGNCKLTVVMSLTHNVNNYELDLHTYSVTVNEPHSLGVNLSDVA